MNPTCSGILIHVMTAHEPKQSSAENSTQDCDFPIAISVTSSNVITKDDRLLGVVTSESSKGKDQAIIIQKL